MSSTLNLIYSYIRPYTFRIMIVFLITVFVYFGFKTYQGIYANIAKSTPFKDVANTPANGKEIVVSIYHVDWCPHCKVALPEWNLFSDKYNNKMVNGYKVVCLDINCTDDKDGKIQKMLKDKNISSFPTVKAVMPGANGKEMTISFESKTNEKNLEKFVLMISTK